MQIRKLMRMLRIIFAVFALINLQYKKSLLKPQT